MLPAEGLFQWFSIEPSSSREDKQNRAMALLAFFGCLRGCELVALQIKDFDEVTEGVLVNIVRIKTTARETRFIVPLSLPSCTVSPAKVILDYLAVVKPWLDARSLTRIWPRPTKSGFAAQFRGKNHVTVLAKAIATFLGLDPTGYTGHSFRRSSATAAADGGISLLNLKRFGGWKSDAVASSYIGESLPTIKDAAIRLMPHPPQPELKVSDISVSPFATSDYNLHTEQQPGNNAPADTSTRPDEETTSNRGPISFNFYINHK